jgi:hypothetical protein
LCPSSRPLHRREGGIRRYADHFVPDWEQKHRRKEHTLATIAETRGQRVMHIVKNTILAGCALASLAWLGSGCQSVNTKPNESGLRSFLGSGRSPRSQNPADSGLDLLETQSKRMAGPQGIDCGRVSVGSDPTAATKCTLAAQESKKPFRVRYDMRGFDSSVAVAIIRTPVGTVGTLQYDSDPEGGGGRAHEVVSPGRCPEPVHLWVNPSGRINCFQQQSSPPRDVMSPNAEPY